ncbi:MAG: SUMF1/EgtB/PvdO family nonheme iron enzyme [Polyangiaceae bacterium]
MQRSGDVSRIAFTRDRRPHAGVRRTIVLAFSGMSFVLAVASCSRVRERFNLTSSRCVAPLQAMGSRCCAPGQHLEAGHCAGKPAVCPTGWIASSQGRMGCVAAGVPRRIEAGAFAVGPNDWESEHVPTEQGAVSEFWMDSIEVTWERFWPCVTQERCKLHVSASGAYEPGQPVVGIDAAGARAFCTFAGGRLPRRQEWLRASAGAQSNRFPWGQTGLVCRRAAYGLVSGPCAEGGTEPEWSGSRPDGVSKDGILDSRGQCRGARRHPRCAGRDPRGLVSLGSRCRVEELVRRTLPWAARRCRFSLRLRSSTAVPGFRSGDAPVVDSDVGCGA